MLDGVGNPRAVPPVKPASEKRHPQASKHRREGLIKVKINSVRPEHGNSDDDYRFEASEFERPRRAEGRQKVAARDAEAVEPPPK